jgi:hypothetical protein
MEFCWNNRSYRYPPEASTTRGPASKARCSYFILVNVSCADDCRAARCLTSGRQNAATSFLAYSPLATDAKLPANSHQCDIPARVGRRSMLLELKRLLLPFRRGFALCIVLTCFRQALTVGGGYGFVLLIRTYEHNPAKSALMEKRQRPETAHRNRSGFAQSPGL